MEMTIRPTQEQLHHWIDKYVPEKDLFFMKESDMAAYENELSGTLVFPKNEFFKHSSYNSIQMVNSYMYWNLSKNIDYVIVAHPNWVDSMPRNKKEALFKLQVVMGRGLAGPLSYLTDDNLFPEEYIIEVDGERFGILQRMMWLALPYTLKEEIICRTAQLYDEWTSTPAPAELPSHLEKYANSFSTNPGANCLAATLYAISFHPEEEEWIIHEWVHGETFARKLTQAGYFNVDDSIKGGDVVVWVNEEAIIQHAAYCIDGQLFFNKNGQTFFNPWKIVHWQELEEEWKKFTPCVYRRDT
ncbi:hypothetical protein MHZ92_17710 [Sporosarcina sp. ACRSL]|uniref:hypothetical protein n=1 Tax=Sporosarcina sp. ACRSL TaxID=2918215 RepID=UPI001EF5F2B4|nr:hypothetical protein [Sporosarcina sp. ACRSL]MCG7345952.1 hypothetical protein [Sporosarcina sp. ACRSL]